MKRLRSFLFLALAGIHSAFGAVNLNTATVSELDSVKGIVQAQAIVDYRTETAPSRASTTSRTSRALATRASAA